MEDQIAWKKIKVDDNPLHDVYENVVTGEKSHKDHEEKVITTYHQCDEHHFELVDSNGNVQCQKCSYPRKIVWGIHMVKDGKIIKNHIS